MRVLTTGPPDYHVDTSAATEVLTDVLDTVQAQTKRCGMATQLWPDFYEVVSGTMLRRVPARMVRRSTPVASELVVELTTNWKHSFTRQGRRWVPADLMEQQLRRIDRLVEMHLKLCPQQADEVHRTHEQLRTLIALVADYATTMFYMHEPGQVERLSAEVVRLNARVEGMQREFHALTMVMMKI